MLLLMIPLMWFVIIRVFHLFDVLDRVIVDEWRDDNRFGYHRQLDNRRFGAGILSLHQGISQIECPTSITINTRKKLHFSDEVRVGAQKFGLLDVPDYVKFWVVDGRHRLDAYRMLAESDRRYNDHLVNLVIYDHDDVGFDTSLYYHLNRCAMPLRRGDFL